MSLRAIITLVVLSSLCMSAANAQSTPAAKPVTAPAASSTAQPAGGSSQTSSPMHKAAIEWYTALPDAQKISVRDRYKKHMDLIKRVSDEMQASMNAVEMNERIIYNLWMVEDAEKNAAAAPTKK
jgi:hypothetical protein